jgi:GTPase SAR1 family protein
MLRRPLGARFVKPLFNCSAVLARLMRVQVTSVPPIVELWDVGGGSMITDSRHVFYDRDYHGVVLVYDATNPKSQQSIARWSREFLSFRSQHHGKRVYPELHVANKADCLSADAKQRLLQQGQPAGNVWHMAASSNSSVVDVAAVSTFLRFVEHLNDSRSV